MATTERDHGGSAHDALSLTQGRNQDALRGLVKTIAQRIGLPTDGVLDAISTWGGQGGSSEGAPTAIGVFPEILPRDKTLYLAAWAGLIHNLPGVVVFESQEKGPDSAYALDLPGVDAQTLAAALDGLGLPYRTAVPMEGQKGYHLILFDPRREFRSQVARLAESFNATVRESTGTGISIGGATQADARAAYRKAIAAYERSTASGGAGGGTLPGGQPPANSGPAIPAPAGGMMNRGTYYPGGQMTPVKHLARKALYQRERSRVLRYTRAQVHPWVQGALENLQRLTLMGAQPGQSDLMSVLHGGQTTQGQNPLMLLGAHPSQHPEIMQHMLHGAHLGDVDALGMFRDQLEDLLGFPRESRKSQDLKLRSPVGHPGSEMAHRVARGEQMPAGQSELWDRLKEAGSSSVPHHAASVTKLLTRLGDLHQQLSAARELPAEHPLITGYLTPGWRGTTTPPRWDRADTSRHQYTSPQEALARLTGGHSLGDSPWWQELAAHESGLAEPVPHPRDVAGARYALYQAMLHHLTQPHPRQRAAGLPSILPSGVMHLMPHHGMFPQGTSHEDVEHAANLMHHLRTTGQYLQEEAGKEYGRNSSEQRQQRRLDVTGEINPPAPRYRERHT